MVNVRLRRWKRVWARMHRKLRETGAFTGLRLPYRPLRKKTEVAKSGQPEGKATPS